jgi:hypothetical protein
MNEYVTIFFHVNDILVFYKTKHKIWAQRIITQIKNRYNICNNGAVKWFLGVRIIRNRNAKRIFLIYNAYIEKVARRFALDNNALIPAIPIPIEEHLLRKTPSTAIYAEVHIFQELVESIIYTIVTIWPDVAWAAALLSRFFSNPLHQHIAAAKQCVRYLYSTKFLAIIYDSSIINALMIAIDASFDDDPYTRKSSHNYVIIICEGPIVWRSGL